MTLAALFVGVSAVVSMKGVLNGLSGAMANAVARGDTGDIQIHKSGFSKNVLSVPLKLAFPLGDVESDIEGMPEVHATSGRLQFSGMLSTGDRTIYLKFLGLDQRREPLVTPLRSSLIKRPTAFFAQSAETVNSPENHEAIVLASTLVNADGMSVGDELSILALDEDGVLSGRPVRVASEVSVVMPGEGKLALVSLNMAQHLLNLEGMVTEVGVAVDPAANPNEVKTKLAAKLGPNYEVSTWDESAVFVKQAIQRQEFVARLISWAFMLLMFLGVANTILLSTYERTREIGTMMALGVRKAGILALFLLESFVLGGVGGVLGVAGGFGVVYWLGEKGIEFSFVGSKVPFVLSAGVSYTFLVQVFFASVLGAAVFGIYPAYRASRLKPVDALGGK